MSSPIDSMLMAIILRLTSMISSSEKTVSSVPPTQDKPAPFADELERIATFHSTATWTLTTLGAIGALVFAGIVINKIPNLGNPNTSEAAKWAIGAVIVGFTAISIMISLVARVLVTVQPSLVDLAHKQNTNTAWVNNPLTLIPPHAKLKDLLTDYQQKLTDYEMAPTDDKENELLNKYYPVLNQIKITARRKITENNFYRAILGVVFGTIVTSISIVTYLAANAYDPTVKTPVPIKYALPAPGKWKPLTGMSTSDQRQALEKSLKDELGSGCKIEEVKVLVLSTAVDETTYSVVVQQSGCNLIARTILSPSEGKILPAR